MDWKCIAGFPHMRPAAAIMVVLGLLLGACSSPATSYNMIVYDPDLVAAHPDTPYRHALAVAIVKGGEETNPYGTPDVDAENFRKALESSLGLSRLLADPPSDARFDLYVNIAKVDTPTLVFDYRAVSRIEYRVIERGTNQLWFSDGLLSEHEAEHNPECLFIPNILHPLVGSCYSVRLIRWANEGSIRDNIQQFIKKLLERKPPST